jgi:hypothetical protein
MPRLGMPMQPQVASCHTRDDRASNTAIAVQARFTNHVTDKARVSLPLLLLLLLSVPLPALLLLLPLRGQHTSTDC